jgi:hypothetical protein
VKSTLTVFVRIHKVVYYASVPQGHISMPLLLLHRHLMVSAGKYVAKRLENWKSGNWIPH